MGRIAKLQVINGGRQPFTMERVHELPLLLTPSETAEILRCSVREVYRRLRNKELLGEKRGRRWLIYTGPLLASIGIYQMTTKRQVTG